LMEWELVHCAFSFDTLTDKTFITRIFLMCSPYDEPMGYQFPQINEANHSHLTTRATFFFQECVQQRKDGQKAQATRLGYHAKASFNARTNHLYDQSRWNPKGHALHNVKLETKSIRDETSALVRQLPVVLHYIYHSQQHDIMSSRLLSGCEMRLTRPRVGKVSLREKDRRRMRCVCDSNCVL